MGNRIWDDALNLLQFDTRINPIFFENILKKMKLVKYDQNSNFILLSCRDDYSLQLVKNQDLDNLIKGALSVLTNNNVSVKYIIEGDEKAAITSTIAESKANSKNTPIDSSTLTSEYSFETFIVGDCNRFAHATAVSVANRPGTKQRNPFYIWGNSGLGKTHLMKAIGYSIIQNYPDKKVLYTTCEEFTNAYVACTKNNNGYESFRNKYRNVDVLLIDDIQFLIGKEGTQMEFFNTFDALINNGKQIVITSDKSPKNLPELDGRYTSRFQNGMMMDIQPPDFETRKAILINKLERDDIKLSDDIVNYICENFTKNIRELNGAYNIVSAYYALENGNVTLESIETRLSSIISPNKKKLLTVEMIIDAVSKYYDITPDKMKSKLRNSEIVNARSVAMYICRENLDMQYKKIGEYFNGRKHTTVMNSIDNVEHSEELLQDVNNIRKRIISEED